VTDVTDVTTRAPRTRRGPARLPTTSRRDATSCSPDLRDRMPPQVEHSAVMSVTKLFIHGDVKHPANPCRTVAKLLTMVVSDASAPGITFGLVNRVIAENGLD
jgi:hypothetical protein